MQKFRSYLLGCRFSERTINVYVQHILKFVRFTEKSIKAIDRNDVILYNSHMLRKQYSEAYVRQFLSALRHYFNFRNRNFDLELQLPKRPKEKKLPVVLSKEEVSKLFAVVKNQKHQVILQTIYATGLRISEFINLKLGDIDSSRKSIRVRQSKNKKDRYVPLSFKLLQLLRTYYIEYKPKTYLVENPNGGKYSAESIRKILSRGLFKAGIQKDLTVHGLRHTYAVHLLENGVSIRHIQVLLGHSKIETTLIYTQLSSESILAIESPLDTL